MIARASAPATTANLGPGFDVLGAALGQRTVFLLQEGRGAFVWPKGVEPPARNLFLDGFAAAFALRGAPAPSIDVEVAEMVPLQSGLGSSAAAICAGLRAADLFLDRPLETAEALACATSLEGHPDNAAACLLGGVTIAAGADPALVRRLAAPPLEAVVLHPGGATSTPSSRAALPAMVPRADAVHNIGRAALLVYAFTQGDYALLRHATRDHLHEDARLAACPWCGAAREAAFAAGALAMPVSGSGPTMLAITLPADAERVARALRDLAGGLAGARVWRLPFSDEGASAAFA